jgi:hypothetical protein
MQVSEQIVNLRLGKFPPEALHIISAHADNVAHPLVIGWKPAG